MYIFNGEMDLKHTKDCPIERRRLANVVAAHLFLYKKRFSIGTIRSFMAIPNKEELLQSISFTGDALIERFGNFRVIETSILKEEDL